MKKSYLKPTTKVVQIHQRQQLLNGSPYDDKKSLNVYDDDVIDQKGNIW